MALKKMLASDVKYLAVHCSATKASQDIGAKDIDRWHRAQGWAKIGYHFVIKRDGTVEKGRAEDEPGAHVQGYNSQSIGICMAGGVDEEGKPQDNFTAYQKDVLWALLVTLSTRFPGAVIQGHRDFPGVKKACPSFDVKAWVKTRTNK